MTVAFIVATAFTLYYLLVIRSEEARLRKRHPEAFEDYRRRVPAFLPRWSLLAEPGEYTVKPKLFRRHVFDALWFVWMAGILEVVEELHELGFLPTFLLLY
jgi:hypothetical protein